MTNSSLKLIPALPDGNELRSRAAKNHQFIVTDELDDEVFNRPDVPDSFRYEMTSIFNNNNNDDSELQNKQQEEKVEESDETEVDKMPPSTVPYRMEIVWRNVITMSLLHIVAVYAWVMIIRYAKWQGFIWAYIVANLGGMGVLAGAHRLWTHRSYKAHWSLRIILMIGQTMALQNDIYEWVRDHRVHHKYSETDADPHNSRRGFFFAHVGWLLCRKHPMVKAKGSKVDMSDVWADPIVRFQRRFYIPLVLLWWGVFPVWVAVHFWNEDIFLAMMGNIFRYVLSLHHAWLVNSAAHMYGYRFYDKRIEPRENYLVAYLSLGEGYHNYHHAFPWDYSASEHGWRNCFNIATLFIDTCAWLGLVTDRRVVSRQVIERRVERTGDTSIIPPLMTKQRKSWSILLDTIMGLLISAWILWLTFFLWILFRHQPTNI